jgi:hypothetical protein
VTAPVRPTLLNGCASAATAAEARFRIDRPIAGGSARVIAMDEGAAEVVRRVAEEPWGAARFLTSETRRSGADGGNGASADISLRSIDGSGSSLSDELAEADVAIMIATSDHGAEAAAGIARACAERGITTAALILGDRPDLGAAVSALRPYARILMVTADEDDVSEVLTALRA